MAYHIQSVTGLFDKDGNVCNGNLLNSPVTPYIVHKIFLE